MAAVTGMPPGSSGSAAGDDYSFVFSASSSSSSASSIACAAARSFGRPATRLLSRMRRSGSKGAQAAHAGDDVEALAQGLAANARLPRAEAARNPDAAGGAHGLRDARIAEVLEPKVDAFRRSSRSLQQGRAHPDDEIANAQLVELTEKASFPFAEDGVGHDASLDEGAPRARARAAASHGTHPPRPAPSARRAPGPGREGRCRARPRPVPRATTWGRRQAGEDRSSRGHGDPARLRAQTGRPAPRPAWPGLAAQSGGTRREAGSPAPSTSGDRVLVFRYASTLARSEAESVPWIASISAMSPAYCWNPDAALTQF